MLFDKRVILLDWKASTCGEALATLANKLYKAGVVTDEYQVAILERESKFPTGLMTKTYGVAIPHCYPDKVITPQIGFMRLAQPVKFRQMGDNAEVEVRIVFMLALKKSDDQLKMLQTLMALFQNQELMDRLQMISSTADFVKIMQEAKIIG